MLKSYKSSMSLAVLDIMQEATLPPPNRTLSTTLRSLLSLAEPEAVVSKLGGDTPG